MKRRDLTLAEILAELDKAIWRHERKAASWEGDALPVFARSMLAKAAADIRHIVREVPGGREA